MRQEHSVTIARPREEVFDFVRDVQQVSSWVPEVVSVDYVGEQTEGVGTKYKQVIREGRRQTEYDGEVVAYERPSRSRVVCRGGGFELFMEYRMDEVPGGTEVTMQCEVPLRGAVKLLTPLIWMVNRHQLRKQTAALKSVLEAGS